MVKKNAARLHALAACLVALALVAPPASGENETWKMNEDAAEKAFIEGRYEESENSWKAALTAAEKDKADELKVAETLNQMTHLFVKHKRYAEAETALARALEIRRRLLGKDAAPALETAGNLALIKHKLGHDKDAEQLFKECIESKRKNAAGSASLATTLTNLGNLYSEQRRCEQARAAYREALAIDEKALGSEHAEVAQDLFNLGALMYRCNKPQEAIEYLQEAETIAQLAQSGGSAREGPSRFRGRILHYLGLCHAKLKQHQQAVVHLSHAAKLRGADHVDSVVHVLAIAHSLEEMGQSEEAEKTLNGALLAARNHNDNVKITEAEIELAHFYRRQKKNSLADDHYKKALETYETLNRHQQRQLYDLPRAYADLLKELKRDSESKEMANKYLHLYTPQKGEHIR